MKVAFSSPSLPLPVGPYSPAVRAGQLLFISGQIPVDPATGLLVDADVAVQTRRVLENVEALLKEAGLGMDAVVRTTVFLADMADFALMNSTYEEFFRQPYPARSTVQAARLPRDVKVEIDVICTSNTSRGYGPVRL